MGFAILLFALKQFCYFKSVCNPTLNKNVIFTEVVQFSVYKLCGITLVVFQNGSQL